MAGPMLCVDASICLKLVVPEHDSALAVTLWSQWKIQRALIIAPTLWGYEMISITRKLVYRGLLAPELEQTTLDEIFKIPVRQLHPTGLHRSAWQLARRFDRPTAYDSYYLALADMTDCAFWTADERLYNSVHRDLPWVHWLGNLAHNDEPMQA